MFIINIRGGLGNQMFQYAFAVVIREKYKEKVIYSKFYIKRETAGRKLSLENLNAKNIKCLNPMVEKIIAYYYKAKLIFYEKKVPKQNGLVGEDNFKFLSKLGMIVTRDMFCYFPFVMARKKIKYVDGYFQSEKYFKEYKEMVINELRVKSNVAIKDKNKTMLNEIRKSSAVCVHIRRGDYISNQWADTLLLCDKDYYQKGIEFIKIHIPEARFFIFTNNHEDMEWIKENYMFSGNITYVDLGNCDYEELLLMYNCKHFILSNSSFSWWAQYLSYNEENKLVVAPSKWSRLTMDSSDLYMKKWHIIDVV